MTYPLLKFTYFNIALSKAKGFCLTGVRFFVSLRMMVEQSRFLRV